MTPNINRHFWRWLLFVIPLIALIACDREGSISPQSADQGLPFLAELTVARSSLIAGSDTTLLTARVLRLNGEAVANQLIRFSAKYGSVNDSVNTDSAGYARTMYFSPYRTTIDTIHAYLSSYSSRTAIVNVAQQTTGILSFVAAPTYTNASGSDTVQVTAYLSAADTTSGTTVTFTATAGIWLGLNEVTPVNRMATLQLLTPVSPTDLSIEIVANLNSGTTAQVTRRNVTITAYGVSILPYPTPLQRVVVGSTQNTFSVAIRNTLLQALPHRLVHLSAAHGWTSESTLSDATGMASYRYDAATTSISGDTIALRYPDNTIASYQYVQYLPLVANCFGSSDSLSLRANGVSTTTIRARVFNGLNTPSVLTPVTFSTSLGTIDAGGVTDDSGMVEVTYTAPALALDGTARIVITATSVTTTSELSVRGPVKKSVRSVTSKSSLEKVLPSSNPVDEFDALTDTLYLPLRGVDLQLIPSRDSLTIGDSIATTFMIRLHETTSRVPIGGATIHLEASSGSIAGTVATDNGGQTSVTFTPPSQPQTVVVTARYGNGIMTNANVVCVERPAGVPANIVFISADRTQIGVRGSGDPETANLVFEVRDANGRPVPPSSRVPVSFEYEGSIPASLEPLTAETDANGRVMTTVNADTVAGTIRVIARVIGRNIASQAIAVAIHGGPPDLTHFTIAFDRANLPGLICVLTDTVRVVVGDRYANPVPIGTSVYFTTDGGVIDGSAQTDSLGRARVVLLTSQPTPATGRATVRARTVNGLGDTISVAGQVIFSGAIGCTVTPLGADTVSFGGQRSFSINVSDALGNPPVAGCSLVVNALQMDDQGNWVEGNGISITGPGTNGRPYVFLGGETPPTFTVTSYHNVSGIRNRAARIEAYASSPAPCEGNGSAADYYNFSLMGQRVSAALSQVNATPSFAVANGSEQITVGIVLRDVLGNFIASVQPGDVFVTASTTASVRVNQPTAATDQSGRTSASMTATSVGNVLVQVRIQPAGANVLLSNQPAVRFGAGEAQFVFAAPFRPSVEVGGDTVHVTATVVDENGNRVEDNSLVAFATDLGSFLNPMQFTLNGDATAVLVSGTTVGRAGLTISSGNASGTSAVQFIAAEPANISVVADPDTIAPFSISQITANVTDRFGNNASGATIQFSLPNDSTGAAIASPRLTNQMGNAITTLTAGRSGSYIQIRAAWSTNPTIFGESSVLVQGNPAQGLQLEMNAAPTTILTNESSTITAIATYDGSPLNNRFVRFQLLSGNGIVVPDSSLTNQQGVATTQYQNLGISGPVRILGSIRYQTEIDTSGVWIQVQ
ncbi:MAG: hypothetical protein OEM52_06810 [bacterium]|nr:hypothetical protein [bacterium]